MIYLETLLSGERTSKVEQVFFVVDKFVEAKKRWAKYMHMMANTEKMAHLYLLCKGTLKSSISTRRERNANIPLMRDKAKFLSIIFLFVFILFI